MFMGLGLLTGGGSSTSTCGSVGCFKLARPMSFPFRPASSAALVLDFLRINSSILLGYPVEEDHAQS